VRLARRVAVLAATCTAVVVTSTAIAFASANTTSNWANNDYTGYCADTTGGYVVAIQEYLHVSGAYSGNVDNIVGSGTNSAIHTYQTNHGLSSDGCAGPDTWSEMQSHLIKLDNGTGCTQNSVGHPWAYLHGGLEALYVRDSNTGYWGTAVGNEASSPVSPGFWRFATDLKPMCP
jgi:hypothetical protein